MTIYRGIPIAVVVFLSTGLTIGTSQYAFGEFAASLRGQFGWTQTQLNLSLTLALVSGVLAPLAGRASDRWGVRPITTVSLLFIAAGFLLRPLMTSLWHWYLSSILIYVGFPGATSLPTGKLVGLWFPATRGRVTGAVASGNNVGGLIMAPLAALLIAAHGWRAGFLAFGLIMLGLAVVAWFVIRDDPALVAREMAATSRHRTAAASPHRVPQGATLRQALASRRFWLVFGGLFAATFTYQGVLTQLRQHFEESGFTPAAATAGLMLIAAMGIGSKLTFGRGSERWTARWACVVSVALQAAGLLIIALSATVAGIWVGIVVFGIGFGALGALLVLVVQEAFGMREFGSIFGITQTALIGSMAAGPALAGWVHDRTGSFDGAFLIIVVIFLIGICCFLLAGAPPQQTGFRVAARFPRGRG